MRKEIFQAWFAAYLNIRRRFYVVNSSISTIRVDFICRCS